jgi:hypothetical protein
MWLYFLRLVIRHRHMKVITPRKMATRIPKINIQEITMSVLYIFYIKYKKKLFTD